MYLFTFDINEWKFSINTQSKYLVPSYVYGEPRVENDLDYFRGHLLIRGSNFFSFLKLFTWNYNTGLPADS